MLAVLVLWALPVFAHQTNLAVVVRHAPSLNGSALVEGSLQQLLGERVTLYSGFTLTGDLLCGKVEITAKCCGSILTSYSYKTDKDGGNEFPGVDRTINMDVDGGRGAWGFSPTTATVTWKTWGQPNLC